MFELHNVYVHNVFARSVYVNTYLCAKVHAHISMHSVLILRAFIKECICSGTNPNNTDAEHVVLRCFAQLPQTRAGSARV